MVSTMEAHNDFAAGDAGFSDDEVLMVAPRRHSTVIYGGRIHLRASIWIVCSIISALSGKHLLLYTVFHFPFTLSLIYVAALFVVYVVHRVYAAKSLNTVSDLRSSWMSTKVLGSERKSWDIRPYVALLPAALCYAVAVPLLLQGLLHLSSLPVILMLFPLVYAVERIVLFLVSGPADYQNAYRTLKWDVLPILFLMVVLLYNEYRLSVNGLFFCILGVSGMGLFRGLVTRPARELFLEDSRNVEVNTDLLMPLMIGVCGAVSSLAYLLFERSSFAIHIDAWTIATIIINIASSIGVVISGTTPLVFSPLTYGRPFTPQFTESIISPEARVMVSAVPCLAVYLIETYTGTIYVSSIQLVAFLASLVALAGTAYLYSVNSYVSSWLRQKASFESVSTTPDMQDSGLVMSLFTMACHLIVILLFTWIVQGGALAALSAVGHGPRPNLDLSYNPKNKFDIVVSMYDEDAELVKETLAEIVDTKYLRSVAPRVIIYTKDPTADEDYIKEVTGADLVVKIENRGREGGTYLYHILHNWNSLSEQTMFIQAHVHNERELIPRIDKFLQQDTGMLSLGFSGITCDCNSCSDRHGWQDDDQILPTLYEQIYKHGTCEDVLLSYKGQFVASARRLRGIQKDIYQGLYDSVAGKSHSNDEPGGDDPSAPVFGYVLERLWSLLLQCSDPQVAVKCPTLLSGWRVGGDVSDCQCLDPLEGIR